MILQHEGHWPKIHETTFVAPNADVIGDVEIGPESSVWFQCVVRGDVNSIRIGSRTNIQDHSTLHVTRKTAPLHLGDDVTVGHRVLLHGCTIGNRILVGMGSIIMDHAEIGDDSVIGAGSLVTEGKKFPPRSLIMGAPAKFVRALTDDETKLLKLSADNYVKDASHYRSFLQSPIKHGEDMTDLETLEVEEGEDLYEDHR